MARVKRGVVAHRRHKKILARAKGYYGARSRVYRVAFQAVISKETSIPCSMDCAYQCWCSSKRFVLQPYDRWLEKSSSDHRPSRIS